MKAPQNNLLKLILPALFFAVSCCAQFGPPPISEINSLAGRTFSLSIYESSGVFGDVPLCFLTENIPLPIPTEFEWIIFDDTGAGYRRIHLDTGEEVRGTYRFTKEVPLKHGRFNNQPPARGAVQFIEQSRRLTYTGYFPVIPLRAGIWVASTGGRHLRAQPGLQFAYFSSFRGTAPISLAGKTFKIGSGFGVLPDFPETLRIVSQRTYVADTTAFNYAYVRLNSSTGCLLLQTRNGWTRLPILFDQLFEPFASGEFFYEGNFVSFHTPFPWE